MASATPVVSVLLSVYDGADAGLLRGAVDSVLRQTFPCLELLVLLDGVRRADLREVLSAATRADARVRLLDQPQRRGLAAALNTLIAEARAPYLARMDADDVSAPDRIAKQVAFLGAHPRTSILGTYATEVDLRSGGRFEKRLPTEPRAIRRFLVRRDPFVHPTVMFRRELFARVGGYSTAPRDHLLEDTELWARALSRGERGHNLPELLYTFHVDARFWARRGGIRKALRESVIRWQYGVRTKAPPYLLAFPALMILVRIAPPQAARLAYRYLRS